MNHIRRYFREDGGFPYIDLALIAAIVAVALMTATTVKAQQPSEWRPATAATTSTFNLGYAGVSLASTFAQPTFTYAVRLMCTTACYVVLGRSAVAAGNNASTDPQTGSPALIANARTGTYLPANVSEIWRVNPGETLAVIQVTAAGILSVTPLVK